MNKNQIILSAIGGVSGVVVLALGWAAYSAWSEYSTMSADLEQAYSTVSSLQSAPVEPSEKAIKEIKNNTDLLEKWKVESVKLVSRGDVKVDGNISPEGFKQLMVQQARELSNLPGGVDGKLVKQDFGFGLDEYITGGAMPPKDKLVGLIHRWGEEKAIVELLANCGIVELLQFSAVEKQIKKVPEEKETRRQRNKKRKVVAKNPEMPEEKSIIQQAYNIKFVAKPASMVKVFNALAANDRFIIVDSFSFSKEKDTIAEIIGDDNKAKEKTTRKSRRRGKEAAKAEVQAVEKKGLVIDPTLDLPLVVSMKITVFDFGTKMRSASPVKTDAPAKNEAKKAGKKSKKGSRK
jgi:hypothetical protein